MTRLCRKVLQQRDLPVGKRPHLLTVDYEGSEKRLVLAERHSKHCAGATDLSVDTSGFV